MDAEEILQAQDPTHSSDLSPIQDRMEELKLQAGEAGKDEETDKDDKTDEADKTENGEEGK